MEEEESQEYYDINIMSESCKCEMIYHDCEVHSCLKCSYNVENNVLQFLSVHNWEESSSYKFLKIRHNIFAESFLLDNYIASAETDYCLRNIGIDSDLSPDIYLGENTFLEFFVSSNSEFAIQNKIAKYGRFENIKVIYVYYDTKSREISCSDPNFEYEVGINLRRFKIFFDRRYNMMKYVRLDSSDLECQNITMGYSPNLKQRTVNYIKEFDEITFEEYRYSLARMKEYLTDLDDEESYDIFFDCESRKFILKRGGIRWSILYDNLNSFEFVKRNVKYLNFQVKEIDHSKSNVELINQGRFSMGKNHKFEMKDVVSYEKCLEYPMKSSQIFEEINNLDFHGLHSNVLSCQSVKKEAQEFYLEWKEQCLKIRIPKIKMTTMLPVMDPSLSMRKCRMDMIFKNQLNNHLKNAAKIKNYCPPRTVISIEEEKEFIKNKSEVEKISLSMKMMRNEWRIAEGSNKMSYDIMIMNEGIRSEFKKGIKDKDKIVDSVCSSVGIREDFKISYLGMMIEKELISRRNRRISKRRIYRDNTILLSKDMYNALIKEKESVMNNKKGNRESEEKMGFWGYGKEITFRELERIINSCWEYFMRESDSFDWYDFDMSDASFPETRPGREMKSYYVRLKMIYDRLKKTNIYRILCIISNMAKSIWAISTYRSKQRAVIFDKFGTESCFVFCNGTGTIQKYKSSKMFKIMIPYNNVLNEICGYSFSEGFAETATDSEGNKFFMTHWMYLKVQHLKYFMEIPMRWLQVMACINSEYNVPFESSDIYKILTMNILNARRKTENLLHDMKYLTYNMFGIRGCYSDLLKDKFCVPNDMWMRYLEEKFLRNIPRFVDSLENNSMLTVDQCSGYPSYRIFHPLSDYESNLDIFNLYVYSSYIFPKGVFTQYTEQQMNMSGIMEIHAKAMSILSGCEDYESVKNETDVEISRIFENDLFFNSGVSSAVGVFAEAELMNNNSAINLRSEWSRIVNSDITQYANSHGLRGEDLRIKKNWGSKGHDIMTKYVSENCDVDVLNWLKGLEGPKNSYDASKLKYKIMSTKMTIHEFGKSHPIKEIQLNNANKVQWGGNREIYIMTFGAKNIQWALEQMFKSISELIDNEMIHVPAAQRLNMLYNEIKIPPRGIRYYLTLDCRKWAPLSNMNKYVVFLNSMSGILPPEFLEDFNYFYKIYYNKQLFFKREDVLEFLKHERNWVYKEYFVKSGDAFFIRMPYSFMMGMFNYLSSIYHAMTQKYFIKEILPKIERKHRCKIAMRMFAHSDDSGGFIEVSETSNYETVMSDVIRMYEAFQKCNNHMLSLKKCAVSNSYFEITSYCFMKTDPMPVLPKFIYNHQINLTPSGYISDVKSLSSNVIEMVSNGASFQCAAMKYICLGQSYRKHCLNQRLDDNSSRTCYDLGGFPMIHPYNIIIYKGNSEKMWISSISERLWNSNEALLETFGAIGDWGEKRGLNVSMITFKSRNNDGRFTKFENMSKVPDDIIPSGHYACYMIKMASRYYRDSMWYSLHDIDGTILQSNMFNNGLCQSYKINGRHYGLKTFCSMSKAAVFSSSQSSIEIISPPQNFDNYYSQIEEYMKINSNIEYKVSQSRAKPCTVNTYYSQWWKRNQSEIKNTILYTACPWMCVLNANPKDMESISNSAGSLKMPDLINALLKDDPLMRIETLTRSSTRMMDRFDTIGAWFFTNSYPMSAPVKLKKLQISYIKTGGEIHPECVASFLFETSVEAEKFNIPVNNIELTLKDKVSGADLKIGCMDWLRKMAVSNDPMVKMIISKPKQEWLKDVNFVSIKQNQYSQRGKYWIGNTTLYMRMNRRQYVLIVQNGRIVRVKCASEYSIKHITDDLNVLAMYGFDYNLNISSNKTKKYNRISMGNFGEWKWTTEQTGSKYYDNVSVDERIDFEGKVFMRNVKPREEDFKLNDVIMDYKKHLILNYGGMKMRCYLICRRPCEECLSKITVNNSSVTGTEAKCKCNYTKKELIENFGSTKLYRLIYDYYIQNYKIIPETSRYICSPGSIMSCLYKNRHNASVVSYMVDYKDEMSLTIQSDNYLDNDTATLMKTELGKFTKIKTVSGKVMIECEEEKISQMINREGLTNVCTALALIPLNRTIQYYSIFTVHEYWYNNTEILPIFITDSLSYINSTMKAQDKGLNKGREIFKEICNEIINWVTVLYSLVKGRGYRWKETTDIKLLHLLMEFRDVGECSDNEVSQRFFYDPVSILGSLKGFLRYIFCFSYRRDGELDKDHIRGYKGLYSSFTKRYRTFIKDKFGYTVKYKSYSEVLISPVDSYENIEFEGQRFYPMSECYKEDFCDDDDCFDEEVMTYDLQEALDDWGIDLSTKYDYCNHSVFMEPGTYSECPIMDDDEMTNWTYDLSTNPINYRVSLTPNNGHLPINVQGEKFELTMNRCYSMGSARLIEEVKTGIFKSQEEGIRLIDHLTMQLSDREYSMVEQCNIIEFDNKTKEYRAANSGVIGTMMKTMILDQIGIRGNDISAMLEGEDTMNRIQDDVEEMKCSNLDQEALAELEQISPDLTSMMKTHSIRVTKTAYKSLKESYMNSTFLSEHLKWLFYTLMKSVIVANSPDMMTEKTFEEMMKIKDETTTRETRYRDSQMPRPGKPNSGEFTYTFV